MLALGAKHLEHSADAEGRTYFNVFLTNPAEAVTDWPDFVDIPARYWEACAMVQSVTGRKIAATDRLRRWLFSHFEADGLAYRPDGPISEHVAELFDQSRLLMALVTWIQFQPDDKELIHRLDGLVAGLMKRATREKDYAYIDKIHLYFGGTLIRGLVQASLLRRRQDWLEFAGQLARGIVDHSDLIAADGAFKDHVHGALCAINGILAYAIVTGDKHLRDRAQTGYKFATSISTSFGFVPELAQKEDDLIMCETCTIMDYLDGALLLARHVDPSYWDIVEKVSRNHLWESQIRDATWLPEDPTAQDEPGVVIRRDLREKVLGAFAGWSAPHCLLACHEHQWSHGWVRTEERRPWYVDKVRAMQGCCSASGIRAAYQVWANVVTRDAGEIRVNLNFDHRTDEVQVTSHLPREGRVILGLKKDCRLRWRVPSHCASGDLKISGVNSAMQPGPDHFLHFGPVAAGARIEITFPLPERTESVTIGNQGFQQYRFDVQWRGDTVTSISPDPANASTGRSRIMDRRTAVSYGDKGVGPIYQHRCETAEDPAAPLSAAPVAIDWYSLGDRDR